MATKRSGGARAVIALAMDKWTCGCSAEAIELSERAVSLLATTPSPWRIKARLELAQLYTLMGREESGLALLEQIGRDDSRADLEDIARLLELRGFACQRLGDAKACIVLCDQAWRLLRNRVHTAKGLAFLDRYAVAARDLGLMSLAKEIHDDQLRLVADRPGAQTWDARLSGSGTLLLLGENESARELLETLPDRGFTSLQRMDLAYQQMLIGFALGDDERILRFADGSVLECAMAFGAPHRIGQVAAAFHRYFIYRRNFADAASLLSRAVRALTSGDGTWFFALRLCEYGSRSDLGKLRDLMYRLGHDNDVARLHASLLTCCMERASGQSENGVRGRLLSIADAFGRLAWRPHEAFVLEYAGERRRARRIFEQAGMHGEIKRLAVRSHRSRLFGRAQDQQLTPREHEVMSLVRQGLTNASVAKALGITKGTVEQHLYWIFTKLGVAGRNELLNT